MLAALAVLGCSSGSSIRLISYHDPYFPDDSLIAFPQAQYRVDGVENYHVATRQTSEIGGVLDSSQAVSTLELGMIWRPRPGKTSDKPSCIDALVAYRLETPQGWQIFRGTAFVYPRLARFSKKVVLEIESGRMQLAEQGGAAPLNTGEMRLSGKLVATRNDAAAVELARSIGLREAAPGPAAKSDHKPLSRRSR